MNTLYICSFGFNGKNLHTTHITTDMTAEQFHEEMADHIREMYGTEYVFITNIPPLTSLHNTILSDMDNGGLPKIFG